MTDHSQEMPNYDAAAESMRLVMPLLTKHAVPPTPTNYAVWFEYVSGAKPELTAEIDMLIAEEAVFSNDINEDLFHRHIQDCNLYDNSKLRSRIAEILGDLLRGLKEMGDETGRYDAHLMKNIEEVQRCGGLKDLEDLLTVLAEETKGMRQMTQSLKEDFKEKSRDIQTLQLELEEVRKSASSDPLTGLPNRRALMDAMEDMAGNCAQLRYSLLMMDIDNFKAINDQHGHLIGDRVIRFAADVIRQNTKGQDTPSRYGGEEFAILLPNTPLVGALTVAEKIRHAISETKLVRSGNQKSLGKITISAGVATCHPGEDSLDLIDRADRALYMAKERGRNKVVPETEL